MSPVKPDRRPADEHLRRAWIMLGWLLAAQVAVSFVGRSLAPLGVLIEEELQLTKAQIGLLPAALFLGQTLVSLPAGFFADRYGSRVIILALSLSLGLFFMLVSLSQSFIHILLFVVLGGLGYGSMHPTSNRGIVYWFEQQRRGTAMGIKQMGVTGGSALGGILLLPLALHWGWRPALMGAALLLVLIGIGAYWFYRDAPGVEFNPSGSGGLRSFLLSLAGLFHHKALSVLSIAAMGLNGAQMCLNTFLVFFVSQWLGYSVVIAGLMLVLSEIGGTAGRMIWGVVSDVWFHGRRIPVLVLIASLTALLSLATSFLQPGVSLVVLVPLSALFGFCIAGFNGIWMNAASESVPREASGMASGFSICIGTTGVIFGPPLFGWLVDVSGNYRLPWLSLSVVMVGVVALLLWAGQLQKRGDHRGAKPS